MQSRNKTQHLCREIEGHIEEMARRLFEDRLELEAAQVEQHSHEDGQWQGWRGPLV